MERYYDYIEICRAYSRLELKKFKRLRRVSYVRWYEGVLSQVFRAWPIGAHFLDAKTFPHEQISTK
jgi:hypothetical protein